MKKERRRRWEGQEKELQERRRRREVPCRVHSLSPCCVPGTSLTLPPEVQTPSPISQLTKLRLMKLSQWQQLVHHGTALPVPWVQSVCLGSKTPRASQGARNVPPPLSQRSGGMGIPLNLGHKRPATGGDLADFRRSPGLCCHPLQGREASVSLSCHAKKNPSIFILPRDGFL